MAKTASVREEPVQLQVLTDNYRLRLPWQYVAFFQAMLLSTMFNNVDKAKERPNNRPLAIVFLSTPFPYEMMHSPSMTSNVPVTKTLLNVLCVWDPQIQGCKASSPRGRGLLELLLLLLCCFFLLMGHEKGLARLCDMSRALTLTVCVCVCLPGSVCERPLHTDPICLVAGHGLGKCVQAKNSHTAQRSNYEPPLRDGEGGRTRG